MTSTQDPTAIPEPDDDEIERRPNIEALLHAASVPSTGPLRDAVSQIRDELFGVADPLPEPLLTKGEMLGPYVVERLLGKGGQANVYEAVHQDLGRRVALKVPRGPRSKDLIREARIAVRLSHPRVVGIEDIHEEDGRAFLVMEFCPGGSLEDRLTSEPWAGKGLPEADAKRIARQVLEGLVFAHGRGVVHCDIKPANVLFDHDGNARLSDLGIGSVTAIAKSTQPGMSLTMSIREMQGGTPLFIAPEQASPELRKGKKLDGRADLYSFGKLLYIMLTGRSPAVVKPPSRIRPELHPAWDEFVFRLVEDDPSDRFPDAKAAIDAMTKIGKRASDRPSSLSHASSEATSPEAQVVGGSQASSELEARAGEPKTAWGRSVAILLAILFVALGLGYALASWLAD